MTMTIVVSPDMVGVQGGSRKEMKSALDMLFAWADEDRSKPCLTDNPKFKTIRRIIPRRCTFMDSLEDGVYFIRSCPTDFWQPMVVKGGKWTLDTPIPFNNGPEMIGPITPDMVL